MKFTKAPDDDWVEKHRAVWERKSGLRDYYQTQIFDRIILEMKEGKTLQLGTGPGLFARYHPGMVNTDITAHDGVDVVVDVHDLQFEEASFANVVGVDVLHHFAHPGRALRECARVLRPGGRIVLVEPWAGPLGWLFYRFVHHEDCAEVDDPWNEAFPADKKPMDGNAAISIIILNKQVAELSKHAPGLNVVATHPFGCLSFLLTGGFQKFGLPALVIRTLYRIENSLPFSILSFIAVRALFVLEKENSGQESGQV